MKRSEVAFSVAAVVLDAIMLMVAGAFAYTLRFRWNDWLGLNEPTARYPWEQYVLYLTAATVLSVIFFAANGLYRIESNRRLLKDFPRIAFGVSATMLVIIVSLFFQRTIILSRFVVLAAWLSATVAVMVGRIALVITQRWMFRLGIGAHRVVLVGGTAVAERLTKEIEQGTVQGYAIVEMMNDADTEALERLIDLHRMDRMDEVIVTNADLHRDKLHALGDLSDEYHIPLRYAIDVFPNHRTNLTYATIGSTPLIEIRRTPLEGWGRVVKRLFDIIVATTALIVLSPVMIIAGIAIFIDSGRPIFFSRLTGGQRVERIGQGGRAFHYLKFRTMIPEAHALRYKKDLLKNNLRADGPMVKYAHDPRITRVGRILRKFSIDELPELWLVLKGTMSLVGPRPHFPEEVEKFKKHHKAILEIKPGITGLSQVSGRNELSFEEEVRLDRHYIEHWSMLLDLWILLKTPWVVVKGTDDV